MGLVLPEAVDRLHVRRVPGERRHVGHRDVQKGRSHGVADGLELLHDRLVVLGVGAVQRVLSGARVVVLAPLVGEELGQLPVAVVAGGPVERDQTDLQPLVARNVGLLAGPVDRVHLVGQPHRGFEEPRTAGRVGVGRRRLQHMARDVDRLLRCLDALFQAREQPVDALFDVGLEFGVRPLLEHVARRLDQLREAEAAIPEPVEAVAQRDVAVGVHSWPPELVLDVDPVEADRP